MGDILGGTVAGIDRHTTVRLDGFPGRPLGVVGSLDAGWGRRVEPVVGERITGEVIGVDHERSEVRLSSAATRHPELWAFLKARHLGEVLTGTVASIEKFGVFVRLDDEPPHPVFPGVGFVTYPELSWRHFDAVEDVVRVGERVEGEFLQFDTTNGEARLSLKARQPDPHDGIAVGQQFRGRVLKLLPFGAVVEITDGVAGLLHADDIEAWPAVGDELMVTVTEMDSVWRRLQVRPTASSGWPGG